MFSHFLTRPVRFTISFLKLGCLSHLAFTYGVHAAPAAGPSMVPTFDVDGTWVAFDMTCRNGRGIRVGDLVTYIIPDESGKFSGVKRVIGMPGDVVAIEPGKDTFLQVPPGHCWVVGDNLAASRDSRAFGPLPLGLVRGRLFAQVLPWSQRRWIDTGLQKVASET
ncbi:hypothetical protein S40285_06747 [Stachybotrys chlorohalonatus IBT 40285]|uniref:Peptidase S26 domain-containing protein n=1 Tax=Stachybotrys chlorohalonatus (strain IBT 40285) TaxID=1283841 RepID=A0A084QJW9_STAC4|nr:hypothetical protein S40285_06747 [Stachybotrys chlorohalonata IBT 40285]